MKKSKEAEVCAVRLDHQSCCFLCFKGEAGISDLGNRDDL